MIDTPQTERTAFQGERGAYSELAARTLVSEDAALVPCVSLADVCAAVLAGTARYGVVPLENSIAGTVPGAYELLLAHDVHIVAEATIPIDHALVATPGLTLERVRRVLSHPVALDQCRRFLAEHPWMEPVAAFDTAGAVKMVMEARDGNTAAIAGRHAAAVYGGSVLAEHLQDHPENRTRFGLLAAAREPAVASPTKILAAFQLPHRPGSLAHALEPAGARGVNLTKIESRPIASRPFEYRFIVELEAEHPSRLGEVIEQMAERTTGWRVLGALASKSRGA